MVLSLVPWDRAVLAEGLLLPVTLPSLRSFSKRICSLQAAAASQGYSKCPPEGANAGEPLLRLSRARQDRAVALPLGIFAVGHLLSVGFLLMPSLMREEKLLWLTAHPQPGLTH